MRYLICLAVLLSFVACGGSGSNAPASTIGASDLGTVTLVIDTRADSDAIVQFQIAGVTLEAAGGVQTGNLLREARIVTMGDPSGEAAGLELGLAPAGTYLALHLIIAPGSGVMMDQNGDTLPVSAPVDVRVPISDGLDHSMVSSSWLLIGHDAPPLVSNGSNADWTPQMSARVDGAEVTLDGLALPLLRGRELAVTARLAGDRPLRLDATAACVYRDENGATYPTRQAFLNNMTMTDDLCVVGNLNRKGRIDADYICRKPGYGDSRLIGRVLALDAANQRFKFRVQAVNPRSLGIQLQAPRVVWVRTENARIEASSGSSLTYAALQVDKLVKVKWNVFEEVTTGGLDVYFATEVAIPGGNSARPDPQWHGRVIGVDVALGQIEIGPRNGAPLRIQGQVVASITITVDGNTLIERQGQGGRQAIGLAEIQPNTDRIWVRGEVVGPALIAASRVRVKDE